MATINGSSYNVGTDCSIVVTDNFGDVFPIDALGHLMDFDTEADDTPIKITPISNGGKPIHQTVWNGGHGRFMFTRVNGSLEQLVLDLMAAYHNSGIIPQFAVSVSILNRDGTVDERLYSGVQFTKPKLGNYKAMKEVDQGLDFVWADCVATGSATSFLPNLAAAA